VAAKPVTARERKRVRELHAQGMSRNQIAKEIGRSWSVVTRIAQSLGLTFDRAAPKAAIEAKMVDAKLRRRGIIERLYGVAETNLARLERERHDMAEVSMGDVVRYVVTELPGADVHRLVGAIGSATTSAVKLEQVDADNGNTGATSMLGALAAGLQVAYDRMQDTTDAPGD
jgi:hypothetical protein